jgi:hypothetical protein
MQLDRQSIYPGISEPRHFTASDFRPIDNLCTDIVLLDTVIGAKHLCADK